MVIGSSIRMLVLAGDQNDLIIDYFGLFITYLLINHD